MQRMNDCRIAIPASLHPLVQVGNRVGSLFFAIIFLLSLPPAPSSFLSKAYRFVCICLLTYSECLDGRSLTMQLELIVNKLTPIILTNLILQSSE